MLLSIAILGTAANACLTKITNDCATAAAGRKPKRHAVANAALIGVVGMNTLLSLTSGIGAELLLNSTGIRLTRATELVNEQTQRVERLKELRDPRYLENKRACEDGKQALRQIDRNTPGGEAQWQAEYTKLYGTWKERKQQWAGGNRKQICVCAITPYSEVKIIPISSITGQ